MPLAEIAYVAKKKDCDAIVLSGSIEPDKKVIEENLAALVAEVGIPVFVGGHYSDSVCDAINKTGAIALGQDISTGLKRLAEHLEEA